DAYDNAVTNTGGTVTVNLTSSGNVQSLSSSSLTVANGSSTTSGTFTFIRSSGSGTSATMTAKIGSTTELTVTLSA
ncbi:MAG TPA: hypothetical protein VEH82_07395, partial [Acidimicrobiales bacterium]|nr:hypothetical protein [Acidimicrobiales bacterium]